MKALQDTDQLKRPESNFIGYLDMKDKPDCKLTIVNVEDVGGEMIDGRKAKEGTYALSFKETPKKLIINGKKKGFIMRTFGAAKKDIINQTVTIYADPTVKFGGEAVGGIKFRGQK